MGSDGKRIHRMLSLITKFYFFKKKYLRQKLSKCSADGAGYWLIRGYIVSYL